MTDDAERAEIESLLAWVRETRERYDQIPKVLAGLRARGVRYRQIARATGLPVSTAQAWVRRVE